MVVSLKLEKEPISKPDTAFGGAAQSPPVAQGSGCFAPLIAAWTLCVGSMVVCLQLEGEGQVASYLLMALFWVQNSVLKSMYCQFLPVLSAVVYWHRGKNPFYKGFLAQA